MISQKHMVTLVVTVFMGWSGYPLFEKMIPLVVQQDKVKPLKCQYDKFCDIFSKFSKKIRYDIS